MCVSVYLSIYLYPRTTGNEAACEQYTRLQRNMRLNNNVADFAQTHASSCRSALSIMNSAHAYLYTYGACCACAFCRCGERSLLAVCPFSASWRIVLGKGIAVQPCPKLSIYTDAANPPYIIQLAVLHSE